MKFQKYPGIKEFSDFESLEKALEGRKDIQVFEKVDGGNCQVRRTDLDLLGGSRANFLKGKKVIESAPWFTNFLGWMYSNPNLRQLPENKIIYGEWSGNHTIDYKENDNQFYLIDVLNMENGRFLEFGEGVDFVKSLELDNIRFAPRLFKGKLRKGLVKELLDSRSALYRGMKEGLVIKDYQNQQQEFYKILNSVFAEKRKDLWNEEDPFTYHRMVKALLRLKDRGEDYSKQALVEDLAKDIKKEIKRTFTQDYVRKKIEHIITEADIERYSR